MLTDPLKARVLVSRYYWLMPNSRFCFKFFVSFPLSRTAFGTDSWETAMIVANRCGEYLAAGRIKQAENYLQVHNNLRDYLEDWIVE